MSATASLVYGVIIIFKRFAYKRFSAAFWYFLSFAVVLAMMIPLNFYHSESVSAEKEYAHEKAVYEIIDYNNISNRVEAENDKILNFTENHSDKPSKKAHFEFLINLYLYFFLLFYSVIWAAGVVIFYVIRIMKYFEVIETVKNAEIIFDTERIEKIVGLFSKKRNFVFLRSREVSTPMLVGIFKKYIIMPDMHFSEEELKMILHHELVHYSRKDILYKVFVVILLGLHWFNPFMYFFEKYVDRLSEISCDEKVIRHMYNSQKQFYGNMLMDIVGHSIEENNLYSPFSNTRTRLKERLENIKEERKNNKAVRFVLSGVIIVLFVLADCLGTTVKMFADSIYEKADIMKEDESAEYVFNEAYGNEPDNIDWSVFDDFDIVSIMNAETGELFFTKGDTDMKYIPSSSFKIISGAVIMDFHGIGKDDMVTEHTYNGDECFSPAHDRSGNVTESFGSAVINNCVPVFCEYTDKISTEKLEEYMKLFGFDDFSDSEKGEIAIGQNIYVTPNQMTKAYAIIANGGVDAVSQKRVIKKKTAEELNCIIEDKDTHGFLGDFSYIGTRKNELSFSGIVRINDSKYSFTFVSEYSESNLEIKNKFEENIFQAMNNLYID